MLEQAFDESAPLLERVKYAAFFSSHMDEFFAVRVAGLLDQAASGLNVRSDDGRTPKAMLAEIRTRVEALTARQATLWADELVPGARRGRHPHRHHRRLHGGGARGAGRPLPTGHLSGPDPARGRAGPAVPVHLRALAEPRRSSSATPRPGRSGSPASRSRRGWPRFVEVGDTRPVRPARGRDRALPRVALPADGDPRVRGLPADEGRRLRGLGRGGRPARGGAARAAPPPLRRHRPHRGGRHACRPTCSSG